MQDIWLKMLKPITADERKNIAIMLSDYWKKRGMSEYDEKWAEQYLIEGHKKEIKSDEFFAFYDGKGLIGVIALIADVSGVAEIRDMVIKPEFRGSGYGKKMLEELIQLAKERKLRKLFCLTSIEGMFKSAGFEKEGVLKNHFAKGENLTFMSKFLQ
jgi:N-acetylglutamate synthase-like GNAT family acetyltransferase